MAKSAVLTPPSRIFLPISGASLLLGMVYGAFTGDWLGISLYLLLVGIAGFAGTVVAGFRVNEVAPWVAPDADPPAYHAVTPVPLPAGGAWSFTAALAVTLVLLGLVIGPLPAYFGLGLGFVTVGGWLARVSADTTGRQINLLPIGIPVLGLFCIASLMFFMSRILLAVPEQASTLIALTVAVSILALATLLALRPTISARTMVSVLGVAGILMIVGGLVAATAGERKIEHHGEVAEAAAATLVAKNIAFDHKELSLPANTEVDVDFKNADKGIPHNVAIYAGADSTAPVVFKGDILAGPAETKYHFTSPPPGDYHFQCDVHPNMSGTVKVA